MKAGIVVSRSLLAKVDICKAVPPSFDLGMSDWTSEYDKENDDDFQPPKKRLKSSASTEKRFGTMVSPEELEGISKGFVPQNTQKNTKWTVSTFTQWIVSRNKNCTDHGHAIDEEILSKPMSGECTELCRVLSLFIVEARKTNGELYPPKTLFHLLAGLLRHARSIQPVSQFSRHQ